MKRYLIIKFLFPLLHFIGRVIPTIMADLEKKMLAINNGLLPNKKYKNTLVLIGHCLQFDECPHRITSDILNCKSCGKCDIADILKIEEKYGIIIKVATGGRLAKKWVNDSSADLVVAVACERELCEGIVAVYPTPVFVIENTRPNGPCVNTKVDVAYLKGAIEKFISPTRRLSG